MLCVAFLYATANREPRCGAVTQELIRFPGYWVCRGRTLQPEPERPPKTPDTPSDARQQENAKKIGWCCFSTTEWTDKGKKRNHFWDWITRCPWAGDGMVLAAGAQSSIIHPESNTAAIHPTPLQPFLIYWQDTQDSLIFGGCFLGAQPVTLCAHQLPHQSTFIHYSCFKPFPIWYLSSSNPVANCKNTLIIYLSPAIGLKNLNTLQFLLVN